MSTIPVTSMRCTHCATDVSVDDARQVERDETCLLACPTCGHILQWIDFEPNVQEEQFWAEREEEHQADPFYEYMPSDRENYDHAPPSKW